MKITAVTPVYAGHNMFVKIETSEGITGFGEATFTSRQRSVQAMVEHFAPFLIGKDPDRIDHLWHEMLRGTARRGGYVIMTAISGVDEALWDIKGKALDAPVYSLLGGACRDKLLLYAHINGETVDDLLRDAELKLKAGYKVLRFGSANAVDNVWEPGPQVRDSISRMKALRQFCGEEIEILYDGHSRFNLVRSVELCEGFAPYRPLFVEDPLKADNVELYLTLRQRVSVPLGTGEKLGPVWDYSTIIGKDTVDYIRTDICNCGGITSMKKIAAYAEVHTMDMVPHGLRSWLGMASAFHVDMAVPNFFAQESGLFSPDEMAGLEWDVTIKDGYAYLGGSPGLGVTVHESDTKPFVSFERPHWQRSDGTLQDW